MTLRFACTVCGKLTSGRIPRASGWHKGTGDYRYPRRHKDKSGRVCKGCYQEAHWVEVAEDGTITNADYLFSAVPDSVLKQ